MDDIPTEVVIDLVDFKRLIGLSTLKFYFGALGCSSVPIWWGSSIVLKLHVVVSLSLFIGVTFINAV